MTFCLSIGHGTGQDGALSQHLCICTWPLLARINLRNPSAKGSMLAANSPGNCRLSRHEWTRGQGKRWMLGGGGWPSGPMVAGLIVLGHLLFSLLSLSLRLLVTAASSQF